MLVPGHVTEGYDSFHLSRPIPVTPLLGCQGFTNGTVNRLWVFEMRTDIWTWKGATMHRHQLLQLKSLQPERMNGRLSIVAARRLPVQIVNDGFLR